MTSPNKKLPILSQLEGGEQYSKWSFINVYSLKDLRDVYLVTCQSKSKSINDITTGYNEQLKPLPKWSKRKILEYVNALVKLKFLNAEYSPMGDFFINSILKTPLTLSEKESLRGVFFDYFRFKELSAWFVNPDGEATQNLNTISKEICINSSSPLYFCSEGSRFTNAFFRNITYPVTKYYIENEIVMRFWDVFLTWGRTLNIIEKFNISRILRKENLDRELSIAYFVRPFENFDLIGFLQSHFNTSHIPLPEIILKAGETFRYSVSDLHEFIISEILSNPSLTFERTSEIFLIKGANDKKKVESLTYLHPKIENSFISHLVLRK